MAMTSGKRWGLFGGIALAVIAVFIIIPIVAMVSTHNNAVRKEAEVDVSFSNISVMVQQRVDALSQMINAVKDAKDFEQEVLTQLIEARSQAAAGQVEQSNLTLNAVAEAYPELQTIALYADINRESSKVETRISGAREAYNSAVRDYRTFTSTIPNTWWLALQGYEVQEYELFTASESAEDFNPAEDNLWDE